MDGICEGWAYERCAALADVELTRKWADGRWSQHELCVEHLKEAIDWWPAENDPADMWTLEPLRTQPSTRSMSARPDKP